MEPDQKIETQEKSGEERPAASNPGENRRRPDPRRGRFRRDDRGGRNERRERPRPKEGAQAKGAGDIRQAIEMVEHIRGELTGVLDEMSEVIRILDQAEREKTASEEEIEELRESLQRLHRGEGARSSRHPLPRPSPPPERQPAEESD